MTSEKLGKVKKYRVHYRVGFYLGRRRIFTLRYAVVYLERTRDLAVSKSREVLEKQAVKPITTALDLFRCGTGSHARTELLDVSERIICARDLAAGKQGDITVRLCDQ
jgi:hypothetical protein